MDLNKLVATYTKMRDALAEKRRAYEDEEKRIKSQMQVLEAALLDHLNKTNSDSVRTDAGTFYRQEDVIPSGGDWQAFYTWVRENDEFEALERRIKKTYIKDYMDSHEGNAPPGVSVLRQYVVRVRRA